MIQSSLNSKAVTALSVTRPDVLSRQSQRLSRLAAIFNALNRECEGPTPVKIEFHDDNETHTLISRILASCDNGIMLEGGHHLPLASIYRIRIL